MLDEISRLNFLAAKIREVRIVVFVPGYESPTSVDRAQREVIN